jgi:hypothetical protein
MLPATAAAEPLPRAQELVASYRAEGDCPDRAEFERRVRVRLSPDTRAIQLRFDVRFSRLRAGVAARLSVVGSDTGSARELSAASCDEAADALALVAALIAEQLAVDGPAQPSPARGVESRQTTPREKRGPASAPAAAAADNTGTSVAAPAATHAASAAEAEDDDAHADTTRTASLAAPRDVSPVAASIPPVPFFSAPRLAVSLAGLAASGVAPHVRPGLGLGFSLSALVRRGPRLGALLGVRATLPDTQHIEQGSARFSFFSGLGTLCVEGPERRFSASGCAVLELGALRGSGTASESGHTSTRFWGALGPGLAGSVELHPRIRLRLGGELLAVLVRDRFLLADQVVFSVPPLAFRAELGLFVTIW